MPTPDGKLLAMRDIMDAQLLTRDGRKIGRVADVEAEWGADGSLMLTYLVTGPQALAGRVASHLRSVAQFAFRDHFEHRIALHEVEDFGPTLRLRGTAQDYAVGQSERWLAEHVLRFIPGGKR